MCHLQNHSVNKLSRKGSTVPQALGFFPGVKSRQPESFRWDSGPLLTGTSLRGVPRPGVQGSGSLRTRGTAGSSPGGRGGRTPAAGAPGAAPPTVNVVGPLLVHGCLSGGRVCPGLPDEADLQVEGREVLLTGPSGASPRKPLVLENKLLKSQGPILTGVLILQTNTSISDLKMN